MAFMETTNYIFTAIFIVEAGLKIFVFGWSYFQTSWNKFDFFVVVEGKGQTEKVENVFHEGYLRVAASHKTGVARLRGK